MRRTLVVLALSGLAATVVGSAASVTLNQGSLQAGSTSVVCDVDGIEPHWGLEIDENAVYSVRFSGIDAACVGAELEAKVFDTAGALIFTTTGLPPASTLVPASGEVKFNFATPRPTPESIGSVKVWIEG